MNKTIKVLLADTSDFFGVPCAAALRSHEMDVIQVEKDGRKLLERIRQKDRMRWCWISFSRGWMQSG